MDNPKRTQRVEDLSLIVGQGSFVDDLHAKALGVGHVVRSSYPHAEILNIDVEVARALPGVQLVVTAADLDDAGYGDLPCVSNLTNRDDSPMYKPPRPVLARDRLRYVGEPIAFVVADTMHEALEAAELIEVDVRELPGASSTEKALRAETSIWEGAPDNVCFDSSHGSEQKTEQLLEQAEHVVSIEVHHPRMSVTPIEPRAALAEYDAAGGHYTLHVQTQGVHMVRRVLATDVMKIPLHSLRVITRDVGGSFGMKIFPYPEYALVLYAAKKLGRPVKWTATRSESFVSDAHGRARIDRARLGLDAEGKFLAIQIDAEADLGASLSYVGPSIAGQYAYTVMGHNYKFESVNYRCKGVFTNATPTDAYRGAGKPETISTVEQLIDKAAIELGMDRIELRRNNFVQPDELPYLMHNGQVIDSGNFSALLDLALEKSDWHGFLKRRKNASQRGVLRGIGLGMYMHSTGGSKDETGEVRLCRDGTVRVTTGTQSAGQGHQTALASLVAEALQIDLSRIEVVQGDTDEIFSGGGTGGSSMVAIAGVTVSKAATKMLEQACEAASHLLEVSTADIDYDRGEFVIAGTDRRASLVDIARFIEESGDDHPGCVGSESFEGTNTTHPCGAYVVEIECDPDTGVVRIIQAVGVDDIGRILMPAIADGQLHGSWAQSIGTSLMECMQYDEDEEGQVLSGSLMDYQLPRAADLPFFTLEKSATLCRTNPLGVKGVGEVASLGAPGALDNAISDLLGNGLEFVSLAGPATPQRVWRVIREITSRQHPGDHSLLSRATRPR
ncbi:MAG: xanthine dehydrogenase family protein molybdopterin-binding subunit [Acidiferrobacterales bacterium]|nr:xanthine dehydrogenase family protein molybdopterin-binding subunit [Acidiferrobacterales bacterium]